LVDASVLGFEEVESTCLLLIHFLPETLQSH
jgi:hypothetical protein